MLVHCERLKIVLDVLMGARVCFYKCCPQDVEDDAINMMTIYMNQELF